jgi:hypothetical protein
MSRLRRVFTVTLTALSAFLALSAIPGGIALLIGFNAPPVQQLAGSVFSDFTIPGLALLLLVGGSAVLATVLLLRKSPFALLGSIAAGLVVMSFEFVEVLAIGSPTGPARVMQILYFGVGGALAAVSLGALLLDLSSSAHRAR